MEKTRIGVIGCGNISRVYLSTLSRFDHLAVVSCADIDLDRAKAAAKRFGIGLARTPEELLARDDIDLVVNLTVPVAHGPVALGAVDAGKSVYNEKPLTVDRATANELLARAAERGLRVGSAPDIFLGEALQVARRAVDEGRIGQPVGAVALSVRAGPEDWHPNPGFFYQPGAGPLFDLGPYFVSALVFLLGSVRRVTSVARASFPERLIRGGPLAGTRIPVSTPTNVAGALDFTGGAVGLLLASFDVVASELPWLEIHGSEGTLILPDPGEYGGTVRFSGRGDTEWVELYRAPVHGDDRGIGAAEMAEAMRADRPHRASGELGRHVVDVLSSLLEASEAGRAIDLTTTCDRPAPMDERTLSRERAVASKVTA